MLGNPGAGLVPVAVLDDDPRAQGRKLMGVPVVGGIDDLPSALTGLEVHQVVLAIPSADHSVVRRAVHAAEAAGLPLRVLPSVADLMNARVSMRDVRDLRIEDLLGRQQVTTDLDAVRRLLEGRRVLITGAGGSIGSEIVRQVAAAEPGELMCGHMQLPVTKSTASHHLKTLLRSGITEEHAQTYQTILLSLGIRTEIVLPLAKT